jgi:hypothetical protein
VAAQQIIVIGRIGAVTTGWVTSFKDIEVTIVQACKEKHPLKLEFFFVIKGGNRYAKKAGEADFPEGEGSAIFSTSTRQSQSRYVYIGFYGRSGEKVEGWLVRALKGDQIIGVPDRLQA